MVNHLNTLFSIFIVFFIDYNNKNLKTNSVVYVYDLQDKVQEQEPYT